MRTGFLQFLGIHNQYQQPQFSFDASDLSLKSSPPTSCALPMSSPEKTSPNEDRVKEVLTDLSGNVKWENLIEVAF